MTTYRALHRLFTFLLIASAFAFPAGARASALLNRLDEMKREQEEREKAKFEIPTTPAVTVNYTAAQIDSILAKARQAYADYRDLRSRLRETDPHEQAFAHRAIALRYRLRAVERVLEEEKTTPTREGPRTVAESLTWLDRSTVAVEYDIDRVRLRHAQEKILLADQPFCVCVAPAIARQSPTAPIAWPPGKAIDLSLAQGEAESAQLIVAPYWEPLRNVRIEFGKIYRRDSIDEFKPAQIGVWLVEAIETSATVGRAPLWADPLRPAHLFDMPATASQAVLLDFRAKPDQRPGVYEGEILVSAEGKASMPIALTINVRPFSIVEAMPEVAFWVQNEYFQTSLMGEQETSFVRMWREFLAPFGPRLYRPATGGDSAAGRRGWLVEMPTATDEPADDPYSLAAPSPLAYRRAAWGSWREAHRELGPAAAGARWLVRGWASVDRAGGEWVDPRLAPFVRQRHATTQPPDPSGLIYITHEGVPQPTLRLIALRDGLEDFAYLSALARRAAEAKAKGSAGWLKRRSWNGLLEVAPDLGDRRRTNPATVVDILAHREKLAKAIEQASGRNLP